MRASPMEIAHAHNQIESLMADGILGMDFLERYQCSIDLNKKVLTLADGKTHTPLLHKPGSAKMPSDVLASETFRYGMEIHWALPAQVRILLTTPLVTRPMKIARSNIAK